MIKLNAKQLLEESLARSLGLDKYEIIMRTVQFVDASSDPVFQRSFNAY